MAGAALVSHRPELVSSLLCEKVLLDEYDTPTLYGAFRQVAASAFPAQQGRFYVVNEWLGGHGNEHTEGLRILQPDGALWVEMVPQTFELPPGAWLRTWFWIPSQPLPAPGRYAVQVLLDGVVAREHFFEALKTRD